MNANSPVADRFEDRLLAAILDDYETLTAPSGGSQPLAPFQPAATHRRGGRRVIPATVATAAAASLVVGGVVATEGHGHTAAKAVTAPGAGAHLTTPASKTAGPVMQLASYRLRLPESYRLTTGSTMTCHAPVGFPTGVGFVSPNATPGTGQTTASSADVPGYAPQMASAANAEGGCVFMVLAPPYTPTVANPDPESGSFEDTPPVQVGSYEARAGTWTSYVKPSNVASPQSALYVEIPIGGGQDQDLAVSSYNLSESALVSLVANGLSVAVSSPSAGAARHSS